MQKLIYYFNSCIPLFILLFLRTTGTTKSEYEANFRLVSGEVNDPYILLIEDYNIITNDSLRGGDYEYSNFMSVVYEYDLQDRFRKFTQQVKTHDMSWGSKVYDSLSVLPTALEWEEIKKEAEGIVYERDTSFQVNLFDKPFFFPVKLSVERSIRAMVFFSLGNAPDRLQILFPKDFVNMDDDYGLGKRIKMSLNSTSFSKHEGLSNYYHHLKQFLSKYDELKVKKLNPNYKSARVYEIWNKGDLIFTDEAGLEGLEYKTMANGMIDVYSGEGDKSFILWYDHWYVYILIFIQLIIFLGILVERSDRKNNHQAKK